MTTIETMKKVTVRFDDGTAALIDAAIPRLCQLQRLSKMSMNTFVEHAVRARAEELLLPEQVAAILRQVKKEKKNGK